MSQHRAFIALGSNLGDRILMVETACRLMEERGIRIARTSSLFETAPMYVKEQDPFINGVCEVSVGSSRPQYPIPVYTCSRVGSTFVAGILTSFPAGGYRLGSNGTTRCPAVD
jgi:hypothetical protein